MQLSQSKPSALLTDPRGSACTSSALLPQELCQPLLPTSPTTTQHSSLSPHQVSALHPGFCQGRAERG